MLKAKTYSTLPHQTAKQTWIAFDDIYHKLSSYPGYLGIFQLLVFPDSSSCLGKKFIKDTSTAYSHQQTGLREGKTFERLVTLLPFALRGMKLAPATLHDLCLLTACNNVRSYLLLLPPETGITEKQLSLLHELGRFLVECLKLIRASFPKKLNTMKVHRTVCHTAEGKGISQFPFLIFLDVEMQGLTFDTDHLEHAHLFLVKKNFAKTTKQLCWAHVVQLGKLSTAQNRAEVFNSKQRLLALQSKSTTRKPDKEDQEKKHKKQKNYGVLGLPELVRT